MIKLRYQLDGPVRQLTLFKFSLDFWASSQERLTEIVTKMPKRTCLSVALSTANRPFSSFIPTCSSPHLPVCLTILLVNSRIPTARTCSVCIADVDTRCS